MTIWVDRRAEMAANAPSTNALVVGTSVYDHLPGKNDPEDPDPTKFGLRDLETPSAGAFAFARWLRDRFHNPDAPLATIRLLLSASQAESDADPELADAVAAVGRPTRETVSAALFEWRDAAEGNPDGIAVLYLSGHGLLRYSYTDSVVLLQDFAADPNVLTNSVDVADVHAGMAGESKARTQLYFVDACRIHPDALLVWRDLGDGVGLPQRWTGPDSRAAPVYFSASPDRPAFGQPGRGTLFSQALLDCLVGAAADDDPANPGAFLVSTYSLAEALEPRVGSLAEAHGELQDVTVGGQNQLRPFHYYEEAPRVPLRVELKPQEAWRLARADLWKGDRSSKVLDGVGFVPHPLERPIPLGLYVLDVRVGAPYVEKTGLGVLADPSGTRCRLEVSVDA